MRFHNSEATLDLVQLVVGGGQASVRHSVSFLTVRCILVNESCVPGKTAFGFERLFINSFYSRLCFSEVFAMEAQPELLGLTFTPGLVSSAQAASRLQGLPDLVFVSSYQRSELKYI